MFGLHFLINDTCAQALPLNGLQACLQGDVRTATPIQGIDASKLSQVKQKPYHRLTLQRLQAVMLIQHLRCSNATQSKVSTSARDNDNLDGIVVREKRSGSERSLGAFINIK